MFVTLTQRNGQPIDVNVNNVIAIRPLSDGGATVHFTNGGYERVKESVDEIRSVTAKQPENRETKVEKPTTTNKKV